MGIVLIVVAGLLTLLAMTGLAFVATGRGQRDAVRTTVDLARAGLLARSGVERATSEVRRDPAPVLTYGGEDHDGDGVLDLAGVEAVTQRVRPGVLDTDTCPVRWALRPTFYSARGEEPPVGMERVPDLTRVDGVRLGYSGRLRGTYADEPGLRGDTYVLRVAEAGGIYVNGGGLDGGDDDGDGTPNHRDPDTGYHVQLRRILGMLAEALDRDAGGDDGAPVDETDGWALLETRPLGGWTSWDQIRDVALGGDREKEEVLRPYLGLRAWVDKKVIVPNATAGMDGKRYHSWGEMQLEHAVGPDGTHRPTFETMGGRVVGRAPVAFSWARTRGPVLMALMGGLRGVHLDETEQRVWYGQDAQDMSGRWVGPWDLRDYIGRAKIFELINNWRTTRFPGGSSENMVVQFVEPILASRTPVETWNDWSAFCDALPNLVWDGILFDAQGSLTRAAARSVVKANFDPNSNLNKTNPGTAMWRPVDKSDLLSYSTEFVLFPVNGHDVESVGRVTGANGSMRADRSVRASVGGPTVVRLTTQREFACEDLGELAVAGDEGAARLPGFHWGGTPAFLVESQGTSRTWGQRLATTGASPAANYAGGWMDGTSRGTGLQLYPEPYHDPIPDAPGAPAVAPADYDGSLQRATIEMEGDHTYGVTAGPSDMTMLAAFDDSFDLDVADNPAGRACVVRESQVPANELDRTILDGNTLYPDGAYCEGDRTPIYRDRGNAHGYRGVISLWVKPAYRINAFAAVGGNFASNCRSHAYVMRTNYINPAPDLINGSQLFFLGDGRGRVVAGGFMGPYLFFESGFVGADAGNDTDCEHAVGIGAAQVSNAPHTWRLATAFWDNRSPTRGNVGRVVWADGEQGIRSSPGNNYVVGAGNQWNTAHDLTEDDLTDGAMGPHLLALGAVDPKDRWPGAGACIGSGADSTIDEVAIWDFGGAEIPPGGGPPVPAPPESLDAALEVASARFAEGRYYAGSVYTPAWGPRVADEAPSYVSAPVALPSGSVLRKVRWTWWTPDADEYAEVELVEPDVSGYLWGDETLARSTRDPAWRTDRRVWDLDRAPPGPFRIRVVFRNDAPGGPVLESPVFDDVTLLLEPAVGRSISAWREE